MTVADPWPPTDPARRARLLADLAHAYFLEGQSKVAIGRAHELSRFQVAALLHEAQHSGIVRIHIEVPEDDTERRLASALGIRRVVTAETHHGSGDRHALAQQCARVVAELVRDGDSLGVSWSRTLQVVMGQLPPLPHVDVIQLAGALSTEDSHEAPRLLAGLRCRAAWPLWAPLVVPDAASLKASAEVAVTLRRADRLDVALIAIGAWAEGRSTVWPRVPATLARQAARSGAVAEISGHLLDEHGAPVATPLEQRIVAASLDQIRAARQTVAVAYGGPRARAVLAACRGGYVDTLVCDAPLAAQLVELLDTSPAAARHQSASSGKVSS